MHRDDIVYDISNERVINGKLMPYIYGLDNSTLHNDIITWLNRRATPIQRKHADKIYDYLKLPRNASALELFKITHGLSINDNYWVISKKDLGSSKFSWEGVNLFNNRLSESLAYLSLTGTPITVAENKLSPEYTGQGTYAKCISREDGRLILYKTGTDFEIGAELFTFMVANMLGIDSVSYYKSVKFGVKSIASPIYTSEKISWISAFDSTKFFEGMYGLNVYDFASTYFPSSFYQMIVLDGLCLNPDRHLQNWAFNVDGVTNALIGMAPVYDFNRALTGNKIDMSREIPHKNLLSAAREAFPKSGISVDNLEKTIVLEKSLPEKLRDPFYNRVLYILGKKSSQSNCF